jgi:hypothetical protein
MVNSHLSSLPLALILIMGVLSVVPSSTSSYAQTSSGMRKSTSGGSLDVLLEPSPEPIGIKEPTKFKVTFLKRGTNEVQQHIDYDFIIVKGSKEVFKASTLAGQPNKPLHTAEGIVTIPYTFQDTGDYLIKVPVMGILFNPIKPESAEFPINSIPEFPSGVAVLAMVSIIGIILASCRLNKKEL